MIINNDIRGIYSYGLDRKGVLPTEIVVHATDGLGTIKWMTKGGDLGNGKSRAEDYKKGIALFHYLIEQDGSCVEIINPDNYVYHSSSGLHDMETIGIELSKAKNSENPTDAQYEALTKLLDNLKAQYPSIVRVTSHDHNRAKYSALPPKPCPGVFDWSRIKNIPVIV